MYQVWSGILVKYFQDNEDEEDLYHDDELDYGYESEAMLIESEDYVRFPLPKALADTTNVSKSDTNILVPRSLFDRSNFLLSTQPTANVLMKMKSNINNNNNNNKMIPSTPSTMPTLAQQTNMKARQLYVNNGTTTVPLPGSITTNVVVPASPSRPIKLEEMLSKDNWQGLLEIDNSDWLISEDFKVLDAIQNIQQLPLSSMSFSSTSSANKAQPMTTASSSSTSNSIPSLSSTSGSSIGAHATTAFTQNWDFVADTVNRYSRILRTPKQCKHRFEQVIGPREEGRVVYDLIKKKKHVIKGAVKLSDDNWQMLRTNQLFAHDNCQKIAQNYRQKFETILQVEQQPSSTIYLTKFKQIQMAQAAHHQLRGSKQGALLHESNIVFDAPLGPSEVSYQRSEREKEAKQSNAGVHLQQQPPVTTTNNLDSVKQQPPPPPQQQQQTPPTNPNLSSTVAARARPSSLPTSTTPTPSPATPTSSTPLSLVPACSPLPPPSPSHPTSLHRSVSNNIIVTSNNHTGFNPSRSQSNLIPSRTNLQSPTPPSINTVVSPSQSPLPTATVAPGLRQAQVLPSSSNTETISMSNTNEQMNVARQFALQQVQYQQQQQQQQQQKTVGTVQISSSDYRRVRAVTHQQQPTANPSQPSTGLQVRTQQYQRQQQQARAAALAALDVRPQLPTSPPTTGQYPTSQQRPLSSTRTPSMTQAQVDYLIQQQQQQAKASSSQSSLPVAVVRPLQHPSSSGSAIAGGPPSISSSPASPLNLPGLNVALPPNKLTTTMTSTTNTTTNIQQQQLRAATAYLSNQSQSTSQQQQQIRQLITNANASPLQSQQQQQQQQPLQQTSNAQRLAEAAQRSPGNLQQLIASRAATLSGPVRNVRILTFTPGNNNPTAGIADTSMQQQQTTGITYNRSNSTSSFPRSTINIDQDISPDLAAQLHRIKSLNVANADPNDASPRAVLVPARTISGSSSSSSSSSSSKIKSTPLIDTTTLGFTTKTSQPNIVLQLPTQSSSSSTGNEETITTTTTTPGGLTRQSLIQQLNLVASSGARAQSPSTISNTSTGGTATITFNRLFHQLRAAAVAAAATSPSTGQAPNEQTSPPPPPPPSSS